MAREAFENDKPHRIDVCHSAAENKEDQGLWFQNGHAFHGVSMTRAAEKCWRKLDGADLIPKVLGGIIFVDREEQKPQLASQAA